MIDDRIEIGQRWLFNNGAQQMIVEPTESATITSQTIIKGKLLQIICGSIWVEVGQIINWEFGGLNPEYWKYLVGQHKP